MAGFRAAVGNDRTLAGEFDEIIEGIERGDGVPEAHYRAGIDRDRDALLEERGVMHLHLGGKDSDTLVFLIQYADQVVLLESDTHMHFRTQPAGKNILALSQSWLADLEHGSGPPGTRRRPPGTPRPARRPKRTGSASPRRSRPSSARPASASGCGRPPKPLYKGVEASAGPALTSGRGS